MSRHPLRVLIHSLERTNTHTRDQLYSPQNAENMAMGEGVNRGFTPNILSGAQRTNRVEDVNARREFLSQRSRLEQTEDALNTDNNDLERWRRQQVTQIDRQLAEVFQHAVRVQLSQPNAPPIGLIAPEDMREWDSHTNANPARVTAQSLADLRFEMRYTTHEGNLIADPVVRNSEGRIFRLFSKGTQYAFTDDDDLPGGYARLWFEDEVSSGHRSRTMNSRFRPSHLHGREMQRDANEDRNLMRLEELNLIADALMRARRLLANPLPSSTTRDRLRQALLRAQTDHEGRADDLRQYYSREVGWENSPVEILLQYLWWGFSQDPDYWINREAEARRLGRRRINLDGGSFWQGVVGALGRAAQPLSHLGALGGVGRQLGQIVNALRASVQRSGSTGLSLDPDSQALNNVSQRQINAADRDTHFRLLRGSSRAFAIFFEMAREADRSGASRFQPNQQGRSLFFLETAGTKNYSQREIGIPLPLGHTINELVLTQGARNGTRLREGTDYEVRHNPTTGTAYILLNENTPTEQLRFRVGYRTDDSVREGNPQTIAELSQLDPDRLGQLVEKLKDVGIDRIAHRIERMVRESKKSGAPLSLQTLVEELSKQSRYSTLVAERVAEDSPDNPFMRFQHLLDDQGRLCLQCDGAQQFLKEVVDFLFHDRPDIVAELSSTLVRTRRNRLTAGDLHSRLRIRVGNGPAVYFDMTPTRRDRRRRLPAARRSRSVSRSQAQRRLRALVEPLNEAIRALDAGLERRHSPNELRPGNPVATALAAGTILRELLEGRLTLEQANQRLRRAFPRWEQRSSISDMVIAINGLARDARDQFYRLEANPQLRRGSALLEGRHAGDAIAVLMAINQSEQFEPQVFEKAVKLPCEFAPLSL